MKKLTLKDLEFHRGEVLTRSQLKNVLGGDGGSIVVGSGTGSSLSKYYCCIDNGSAGICTACVTQTPGTTIACSPGWVLIAC